ncbi:acetyl-CoA carboxylase biotin carboxyl carrier protein, partial [Deinococcus sp. RIT780]|uniref:acetyl-CoA carboxylase biotin carboxyl carrier protein n=1 Tax=Deinococcus sp. RIT780 TaxID=2870472 RepID=UPI001C8A165E
PAPSAPAQPEASAPAAPAQAAPAPEAPAEKPASKGTPVKAPIVGTFYASSSPDAPPYVKVGDTVTAGQVLCIIEAMKLMNEIEAEQGGTIREILVKNAEPVEYGQTLFIIE